MFHSGLSFCKKFAKAPGRSGNSAREPWTVELKRGRVLTKAKQPLVLDRTSTANQMPHMRFRELILTQIDRVDTVRFQRRDDFCQLFRSDLR